MRLYYRELEVAQQIGGKNLLSMTFEVEQPSYDWLCGKNFRSTSDLVRSSNSLSGKGKLGNRVAYQICPKIIPTPEQMSFSISKLSQFIRAHF
jgi:hypothetical protein